jgi:hypothetical protein
VEQNPLIAVVEKAARCSVFLQESRVDMAGQSNDTLTPRIVEQVIKHQLSVRLRGSNLKDLAYASWVEIGYVPSYGFLLFPGEAHRVQISVLLLLIRSVKEPSQ